MKKRLNILSILLCAVLIFGTLFGCDFYKPDGTPCTITLVYNNGTDNFEAEAIAGETFETPIDPVKENYVFTGWYLDENLTLKYDFSKKVRRDFTLYAGYVIDGAAVTNAITTKDIIKGAVEITFSATSARTKILSTGSGFCFLIESDILYTTTYYILTNCHVVYYDKSVYGSPTYTVTDCNGKEWTASLYSNHFLNGDAIDSAYDLAILTVTVGVTAETMPEIIALDFAAEPKLKDDVIALGSPLGQNNAITFGKVEGYTKIDLQVDGNGDGEPDISENQSNVDFDVIRHTAYTDHGSSGGALISPDFKVVGVNYAGTVNKDTSEFMAGYAVPSNKVLEFLDTYLNKTL